MTNIPETRKAVQFVKYGTPGEALVYREGVSLPKITKPSQVLVRVKASGAQTAAAVLCTGLPVPQFALRLPWILGMEFSGVIAKTGDKVEGHAVGDEVYGVLAVPLGPNGTDAEYIVVDTLVDTVVKKPTHVTFEEAAAMGTAFIAYNGVIEVSGYDVNDKTTKRKIIVIGATGGIGSYAVQISKIIGAETVGICNGRNEEYAKELGADRVIDYTQPSAFDDLVKNEAGTYDMILDTIGGDDYYFKLKGLLKEKTGIYSTGVGPYSMLRDRKLSAFKFLQGATKTIYRQSFASTRYALFSGIPPREKFAPIAKWLETRELRSTVRDESNIYDLKDVHKAYDHLSNKNPVGRVVLRID